MKIHIFPFSPRQGTPAAEFPDQVDPLLRKERCRRLALLERQLAREYYQSLVGRELEVLVEGEERPGWVRGTDRRYVPVELPGTADEVAKLVAARGRTASEQCLLAER